MPRGDGTGPQGLGPMTGRGAGYCAGYNRPGYTNFSMRGRGFFGRGGGYGWRNWARTTGIPGWQRAQMDLPSWGGQFYQPSQTQEKEMLDQQKDILNREIKEMKDEIQAIEDRLQSLKGSKKSKK